MESTKVATYADAPTVQTTMGTGACVITQKENSMANNGTQTVEQPTIQQIVDAAAQAPQVAAAKPPKPEPVFVLTPYQGTKLVNQALAEAGVVDKDDPSKPASVNSPMMYIYAKKGAFKYHKATKVTKKGTSADVWELDIETFKAWVEEYVTSRVAKQAKGEMDAEMARPATSSRPRRTSRRRSTTRSRRTSTTRTATRSTSSTTSWRSTRPSSSIRFADLYGGQVRVPGRIRR